MRVIATFLFILLGLIPGSRAETVDMPVLVELYTAQGCVSCPPADKLLAGAADHPSIIALACHVTYWDYLGWKDTLAQKFCDHRQFSYMPVFNLQNYYTPQMVVNGRHEFIGHNPAKLRDAIVDTANHPLTPIPLEKQGKTFTAALPAVTGNAPYTLWVFGYKATHTQDVQDGENKGKTMQSVNSVVYLQEATSWSGGAENRTFALPDTKVDGIVLVAQEAKYGPIVAAGRLKTPLRP